MPANPYAKLGLAHTQLQLRIIGIDPAQAIMEANGDLLNSEKALRAADIEVASGSVETAFLRLLELIKQKTGDERVKVKDRLVELFSLVDPADPRVIKARAELANALY
jgi:putative thioredoxin